jgi:hypothetical protein
MKEKESESFKIRLDDDELEPGIKESIGDLQVRKLNQRLTLFAVLIPCLIGVLLIFAYIDLKNRMTNIHATGSTEVKNLSQDIESRLSALTLETARLKEEISSETESLKKKDVQLAISAGKNKSEIKKINSSKADKRALKQSMATVEANVGKKIPAVNKRLKEIDTGLTSLDKKTTGKFLEIEKSLARINGEFKHMESNIAFLSDNQIDQRQIDLSLDIQEKKLRLLMIKEGESIKNQIIELKSKTKALEKKMALLAKSRPAPEPAGKNLPQETQGIVEQDIQE